MLYNVCIMRTIIALLIGLILVCPLELQAWSTYTHGAVTLEAAPAELLPAAAGFSILPDVSTNFFSPSAKDRLYAVFHSAPFAAAMNAAVAGDENDRNDRTALCGYLSHVLADPVAHGDRGYPNARKIFARQPSLDHYVAYLFLDLLCYDRFFRSYNSRLSSFIPEIDVDLTVRAGREWSVNGETLRGQLRIYRASIAMEQAIFETIIGSNPELFAELQEEFADAWLGVDGCGGFQDAVAAVREGLELPVALPNENPDGDWTERLEHGFVRVGYELAGKISTEAEFLRTGSLTSAHLQNLVDRLFRDKSESSRAMGKLLSLMLFRRDLSWPEIVAQVDGQEGSAQAGMNQAPYRDYRERLQALRRRQSGWLRIVPFSDGKLRQDCAEAFAIWRRSVDEARLNSSGLGVEERAEVREIATARWQAWRELQSAHPLNLPERIRKQAIYDRTLRTHQLLREGLLARTKALWSGQRKQAEQIGRRLQDALRSLEQDADNAPQGLAALLSPRRALYRRAYQAAGPGLQAKIQSSLQRAGLLDEHVRTDSQLDTCEVSLPGGESSWPEPASPAEARTMLEQAYRESISILARPEAERDTLRLNELARMMEYYRTFLP